MSQNITWTGESITFDRQAREFACKREAIAKALNVFVLPNLFFHPGIVDQEWYALTKAAEWLKIDPPPKPDSMREIDDGKIY